MRLSDSTSRLSAWHLYRWLESTSDLYSLCFCRAVCCFFIFCWVLQMLLCLGDPRANLILMQTRRPLSALIAPRYLTLVPSSSGLLFLMLRNMKATTYIFTHGSLMWHEYYLHIMFSTKWIICYSEYNNSSIPTFVFKFNLQIKIKTASHWKLVISVLALKLVHIRVKSDKSGTF